MHEKANEDDYVIDTNKKKKLKKYDALLKGIEFELNFFCFLEIISNIFLFSFEKLEFKYQEALDEVLKSRSPISVYTLLEELIRRNGLKIALSGRDEITLEPFVSYIIKFINMPRYTKLLIEVSNVLFDIYASVLGHSVLIDELFIKLKNKLNRYLFGKYFLYSIFIS